jgi:hypothetical protein
VLIGGTLGRPLPERYVMVDASPISLIIEPIGDLLNFKPTDFKVHP